MTTSLSSLQKTTDATHAPARPLVLVADDHADTRLLFRTVLEVRGFSVIEAADGEETVRTAEKLRPDLILMDCGLPRLSGVDATRRIRASAHIGQVPIIFISGHAGTTFVALAREAGCDEYLVKPFDLDQLEDLLEKYRGAQRSDLSPLDVRGMFTR
jgi:CheY-like chemotaxis protein